MGPRPVDRVVMEARNDMPVAMIDRLAGGSAVVDDHVESVRTCGRPDRSAEPGQERADVRGDCLGQLAEMGMVGFGHDQSVAVDDRIDVQERHGIGRLQYASRRDLAVDDLAEDAMWVVRSHVIGLQLEQAIPPRRIGPGTLDSLEDAITHSVTGGPIWMPVFHHGTSRAFATAMAGAATAGAIGVTQSEGVFGRGFKWLLYIVL
jgi:hypothetical protein